MIQPTSPEIHPKKPWVFNGSKTSQQPAVDQPLQSHRVVQCHWCVESTPVQLQALVKFGTKNSVGVIFWLVPVGSKENGGEIWWFFVPQIKKLLETSVHQGGFKHWFILT